MSWGPGQRHYVATKHQTLTESLAELEATDPDVAAAAKRLDDLPERLDDMQRAIAFRDRLRAKTNRRRKNT